MTFPTSWDCGEIGGRVWAAPVIKNTIADTPKAVLQHIIQEYKEYFLQYQTALLSEYLDITYSAVLLAINEMKEHLDHPPVLEFQPTSNPRTGTMEPMEKWTSSNDSLICLTPTPYSWKV